MITTYAKFTQAIAFLPVMLLALPDTQLERLAKDILNEFFTDEVDEIMSIRLDGDAIVGEFSDRVGLRDIKRYQYRITEEEVSYRALNADEIARFSVEQFAAKKKRKKRNCVKGTPCGRSCISAKKTCRKTPSKANQQKVKQAKQMLGGGGTQADPIKAKIPEALHSFADFVQDPSTPLTDTEMLFAKEMAADLSGKQKSKIERLKKEGITELEAAAFEGYIGGEYAGMNQALYDASRMSADDPDDWAESMIRNKLAVKAMDKMPATTIEDMNAIVAKNPLAKQYKEGDPLLRHMTLDKEVLESFVGKHQAALDSDDFVVYEQFLSTTFKQDGLGYFSNGANVEMRVVSPKLDGTGNSVLVDKYKNSAFESEVLYKPMSRFKVKSVTQTSEGTPDTFEDVEVFKLSPEAEAYQDINAMFSSAAFTKSLGGNEGEHFEASLKSKMFTTGTKAKFTGETAEEKEFAAAKLKVLEEFKSKYAGNYSKYKKLAKKEASQKFDELSLDGEIVSEQRLIPGRLPSYRIDLEEL